MTQQPPTLPAVLRPPRRREPSLLPEAIAFQADLEELIAQPPPRLLRGVHAMAALLFLAVIGLACLVQVDVVVLGQGRLAADAPPLVLQPLERAVLREVRVRAGQAVAQGEVLALLDPTFSQADRAALEAQHRTLVAQLTRIAAERDSRDAPPPDLRDLDALLQGALHARRRAVLAARLRAMEQDMQAGRSSLRALEQTDAALAEQVAIARDVEGMRGDLMQRQIGSRLNWLAARAQRLQAEQELEQARSRMRELQHTLQAKAAERAAFQDDWNRQLIEEEVRLRGELSRIEEALAKARRIAALTEIAAPQAGVVLEVAKRSAGSVLREAEPLIVLVPAGVPLIAEVTLRSADIGLVKAGDRVAVKVDAFPFQRHGTLEGVLRAVVQDSQPGSMAEPGPAAGAGLHRAVIEISQAALQALPAGAGLIPGMTVTAEIATGTRSVISYVLQPLIKGARESLREP